MEQGNECVLMQRESLVQLLKKCYRASYMVLVLEYVCHQKQVQFLLTANEICEVLGMKPEQLEEYRKRKWIKASSQIKGHLVYRAYDVAVLAERIRRRKMLRVLNRIPAMPSEIG